MTDIGQNILRERLKTGLTQAELARRSGISQPNLSAIETGGRDMTVSTLRRIGRALGIMPGVLLGETPAPSASPALTRSRVEHIARLVVRPGAPHTGEDETLASLFRRILPASGAKRRPAKRTLGAWLELRARLNSSEINGILGRIRDERLRTA